MRQDVTVRTKIQGTDVPRTVTLWLNRDLTVSLLGNLPHGTEIIVDQELVDDLQAQVNTIKELKGK